MSGESSAALFDVLFTEILARGNERGEMKLFPQELVHGKAAIETRATVEMMVKNNAIENLLIGGPVMICGHLNRGDVVLSIDGRDVSRLTDSLGTRLIGSDIPDTLLGLQVRKKNGQVIDVLLARTAAQDIAAKRYLFNNLAHLQ